MIIFDLDGTLAHCEHRKHFVDPSKRDDCYFHFPATLTQSEGYYYSDVFLMSNPPQRKKFIPDWRAFHNACDQDKPIEPVIEIWNKEISLGMMGIHQIWSGRCEYVREKTEQWLNKNLLCFESHQLKMRPIGDSTPDDVLKEKWLDKAIAEGKTIDYAFDSDPKSIEMWRRRGIFVFNCC